MLTGDISVHASVTFRESKMRGMCMKRHFQRLITNTSKSGQMFYKKIYQFRHFLSDVFTVVVKIEKKKYSSPKNPCSIFFDVGSKVVNVILMWYIQVSVSIGCNFQNLFIICTETVKRYCQFEILKTMKAD